VVSDSFGGARAAVAHLVELGHRDVAFIGGPFHVSAPPALHRENTIWSIEQRALGYWAALRQAGIQPDNRLYEGDNHSWSGRTGIQLCAYAPGRTKEMLKNSIRNIISSHREEIPQNGLLQDQQHKAIPHSCPGPVRP
jgi:hypothetical protein